MWRFSGKRMLDYPSKLRWAKELEQQLIQFKAIVADLALENKAVRELIAEKL